MAHITPLKVFGNTFVFTVHQKMVSRFPMLLILLFQTLLLISKDLKYTKVTMLILSTRFLLVSYPPYLSHKMT